MLDEKVKQIHDFCVENANPAEVEKMSRYFKGGFDGYGLDRHVYESQRDAWIEQWQDEMTVDDFLDLGDKLTQVGKYEEISFAIGLLYSKRLDFTENTFDRIGRWFVKGIDNWANTDVLCMTVIAYIMQENIISYEKLGTWVTAESEWQRRVVPVTLVEMVDKGLEPETALPVIAPLMTDTSEYVQKGIGTLLRGLWKKYPKAIEDFLMQWKDECGRLIIQYATEKMDKEYRKKFRRAK